MTRTQIRIKIITLILVLIGTSLTASGSGWPRIYWSGPTSGKLVALTFDDAPLDGLNELLSILDEHNVTATFFVEGQFAVGKPYMLGSIVAGGHELANHSYGHEDLTTLTDDEIRDDLVRANDLITANTGIIPHLFRPPGGMRNSRVDGIVTELDMVTVMWTVNTADYLNTAGRIRSKVLNNVSSGGIVLMHDGLESTREALPDIITTLRGRGYTFVTVGEMLEITHGECPWPTTDESWQPGLDEDEIYF